MGVTSDDWSAWFEGKQLSSDWTSTSFETWAELFASRRHEPLQVLEIGSWEGRSALFFLHYLPACTVTCVDPFTGGAEHVGSSPWAEQLPHVEARFRANTAEFGDRVRLLPTTSADALARLAGEGARFDLVFVDGSHESDDVLADGEGAWALLRPAGWLVFDDYEWSEFADPRRTPKPGVDAFLAAHAPELDEVHRGWQVVVRRHEGAVVSGSGSDHPPGSSTQAT